MVHITVTSPCAGVRVLHASGVLDQGGMALVARIADVQVKLAAERAKHLVLDLGDVDGLDTRALPTLRQVRADCDAAGVRFHLSGCHRLLMQMPMAESEQLAAFSRFPTEEIARGALAEASP